MNDYEFLDCLRWVDAAASRYSRHSEFDDLKQEARLALWQCVQRCDGRPLRAFAKRRVVGAMVDYLRYKSSVVRIPRYRPEGRKGPYIMRPCEILSLDSDTWRLTDFANVP